ncbi:MAG: 16S rRNA (adenine(1518)-N(6)/adenine(1519)-N(6))-dimethyltransferase RsmA [Alphaproteobacteria bacterium]
MRQLPPLREVIAAHGLAARKSLGQNFLLDGNLTAKIARAAGDLEELTVLEIGPGPGGLTRALLASDAKAVVAIERDERCLAALADLAEAYPGRLRLVAGDALEFDAGDLVDGPAAIVANLPYNVATALLLKWSQAPHRFRSLTLMFQKEVAQRLAAAPGNGAYGRLSVLIQWLYETTALFDIPPRAFTPAPKVTSTLVRLVPRPAPLAPARRETLERVTAAAFGQRRKMLRGSLKNLGVDPLVLLEAAGIAPEARAETVSVEGFCALAQALDG